jgi:cyclic dehypoxanthinyl futalosine synthase
MHAAQRWDMLADLRPRDLVVLKPTVDVIATGMEYVKTVALTRLCLDNVPHIQASWNLFGLKVAQVALRFGADDLGSVDGTATTEELRRLIRDAGFSPKQRDALFRSYSIA